MPKRPTLASKLRSGGIESIKTKKRSKPLWEGPTSDGPEGGLTQSLLSSFLVCRERFRVRTIEGLHPPSGFSPPLEFGSMWHICEEYYANNEDWNKPLIEYAAQLTKKYRQQQEQVEQWYLICCMQFPIYVEFWEKHRDVKYREPLFQEEIFHVPYKLPSGRTVWMKGKWDSVDLIGRGKNQQVFLQENKTKGQIIESKLQSQLQFDLQSMYYLTALWSYYENSKAGDRLFTKDYGPPAGVRYNVVRRPLSGGKGSIRRHKPSKKDPHGETKDHFYERLGDIIREDKSNFFMRWKVAISKSDIDAFRIQFLEPLLEQICDWYEWIVAAPGEPWRIDPDTGIAGGGVHWRHPFGVYNVLNEGGSTELDEYLATGSDIALQRSKTLFPEL